MALNEQQKHQMAAAIAAHPKYIIGQMAGGRELLNCAGRFCGWQYQLTTADEGQSAAYIHARHVTEVIEKVTGL